MARAKASPEPGELGYWESLKPGDWISVRDSGTFASGGLGGIDWRLGAFRDFAIRDRDGGRPLMDLRLFDLEGGRLGDFRFAVLRSGADFELRLYFAPAAFAKGTRDRLVDLDQTWLFLPPPDPEDFLSSDLEYAPWPDIPAFDDGDGVEASRAWGPAGFGHPVYGSFEEEGREIPVILVEYEAQEEAPNPLLLVIEERWMRPGGEVPPEGGFVSLLAGRRLSTGDLVHLPA